MAIDVETMRAKLRLDSSGFQVGIEGAQKQVSGFRKVLSGAGATAAGFLAANVIQRGISGFTNQIGGMITAASDMNETVSKTKVVFGESFDAIDKWAKGSAKALGLSKQEALDTVSTYGAMAIAAGVSGDAAVKFGEDLVGAAADLGSFWNFDPSQVAADIRSGLAGESEPLRKYNIYLTEASVKAKAMEMGLVGANGQLSEGNKILARQALIMEQLGPAAGDYARTQTGLANGTRTLKAYFKNFQAFLGAKVVPTLARVVAFINKFIARIIRLQSKGLSPLQAVLKAIRIQIYQTFGRGALDVVNAIAHAIVWGFNLAKDAIGAVTGEIGKWVKVMGWAFSDGLKVSSLMYAFPAPLRAVARGFLLIADAVGDAFHAFQSGGFSGLLKQLPDTLGQIWDGLKNIGGAAINLALDTAISIGGWLWDHKDDIWGGIKSAVGWVSSVFEQAVTVVFDSVMEMIGWLWDHKGDIWGGIKTAIGWVTSVFEQAITIVFDGAIELAGEIGELAKNTAEWIKSNLHVGGDQVIYIGKTILEGDITMKNTGTDEGEQGRGSVQKFIDGVKSTWNAIAHAAEWVLFNFGYGLGRLTGHLLGIIGLAAGGIVWALAQAIMHPIQTAKLVFSIITAVSNAIARIKAFPGWVLVQIAKGFWDGLSSAIGEMIPDSWGQSIEDAIHSAADWEAALVEQGAMLVAGLALGALEEWNKFKSWLAWRGSWAVLAVGDLATTLAQKGKDLLQGLWGGSKEKWILAALWMSTRPDAAIKAIGVVTETLHQKGNNLIAGMWNGMTALWSRGPDTVKMWLEGRGQAAIDAVGALIGKLEQAGKDLIQGMYNGAKYVWDHTLKPLYDLIANYLPGFGNSPWPLTIAAGKDAMKGLQIGIEQGARGVFSAMDSVAGGLSANVNGGMAFAGPSGYGSGWSGAGGGGGTTQTNTFHININGANKNGRQLADEIMAHVAREIGLTTGGS